MRWFLFTTAFLTSCCCSKVQNPRDYVDIPDRWSVCSGNFVESEECFKWWSALNDPVLDELIALLSERNLDLLIKAEEFYSKCGVKKIQCLEYHQLWNQTAFDLAKTYIELRLTQERQTVLDEKIDSFQDSHNLTNDLYNVGFANSIEKIHESERFATLQSERAEIELGEQKAINHLSVLLGYAPGELYCLFEKRRPLPTLPCSLPIGYPCGFILERPDVLMTEMAVKAGAQGIRSYKKSVLFALEEVENALADYKFGRERARELLRALQENYKAYLETEELFNQGLKSALELQETRRTYLMSHETYLQVESALIISYFRIYEALGAGECGCL